MYSMQAPRSQKMSQTSSETLQQRARGTGGEGRQHQRRNSDDEYSDSGTEGLSRTPAGTVDGIGSRRRSE